MIPLIITGVVGGAAATAGGWAFNQVVHVVHKVKDLTVRVDKLEATKAAKPKRP